jgi:hypothetical protein
MVKALRAVMILYSLMLVVLGLLYIFVPETPAELFGFSDLSDAATFFMAAAGVAYIAIGAWAIAAARDILNNTLFPKLLITKAFFAVAGMIYAGATGLADFSDLLLPLFTDGIFGVLLLAFYPRKAKQGG